MDNIFVNTRSSIKLTGTKTIYFDPLEIEGEPYDADMVFVTHEHYDHFSPDDIEKVLKQDTQIIVPSVMLDMVRERFSVQTVCGMLPQQTVNCDGVKCQAIPAYNIDKAFHPKSNEWIGYVIELDGNTYYAMGDTDVTEEVKAVEADVVFIPIGGKYTMDATEAAEFIKKKQPELVIPIHYADPTVGEAFCKMLGRQIEIKRFW